MELSGTINRSITLSGSMIARGLDGRGIVSIAKTGTSGLVDTYTITYTDATTSTFTVTNGANGQITATSFAEEFSSSKAYAAGDYVVYSGQLYQFTTAHAAGAWNASHATAVQIADQVSELKSVLDTKANINGSYIDMTVGNAEQLVSTVGVEDKVPYNFRTSGGSADIGDREYDEIVGGTIAWNQMFEDAGFQYPSQNKWLPANGLDSLEYGDGVATAVTTANVTQDKQGNRVIDQTDRSFIQGHKYLFVSEVLLATDVSSAYATFFTYPSVGSLAIYDLQYNVWTPFCKIFIATGSSSASRVRLGVLRPSMVESYTFKYRNVGLFDLTQMFGSTVADYIYSLEQANAGAGVAFFRKLFPNPYYAYNTGELISVGDLQSHDMVGFNQWDEEWEVGAYNSGTGDKVDTVSDRIRNKNPIHVLPSTTYYFFGQLQVYYYDFNHNYIGWNSFGTPTRFTTPSNCHYISFNGLANSGTTYNHDICINLSWDGERDGEYEPYVEHSYPLDSSLTLRGIPKLDANNSLYYDGDTYESDGTVTRRYGIVDLGTLDWGYQSAYNFFTTSLDGKAKGLDNGVAEKYTYGSWWAEWSDKDKVWCGDLNNNGISFKNTAYTDVASFKAAMSGVYLVYELAEPTTETADPYQNPQIVDDFGTEEYIVTEQNGVAVPVGHETTYQANLRAKLEMAPDSPDGDGDYIVRQSNGQNSYVPITFPADELPPAPTTDGNYVLKCNVADGSATFTWATA